uniref:FDF domain-containing protein n=1 Tax=Heligmosomoides polygyrus TaxID=6339 RepID=A0A183F2C3_HELPZ
LSVTPQFRSFEPQVPVARDILVAKVKNRGKTKGPSGDPLLDSKKLRGRIANGNDELVKPIDFELLNTDFDFDANLEQFKRENMEDEYYESVEKQKMSQNFAHYENIIDDPSRLTSWTSVGGGNASSTSCGRVGTSNRPADERRSPPIRPISFCPSGSETTYDGFPLPVLDAALKKKYLSECCSSMGADVYFYLVADRLIMWLIDVVGRLGISLDHAVVLASSSTHLRLVDRILSHLDNRGPMLYFGDASPTLRPVTDSPSPTSPTSPQASPTSSTDSVAVSGTSLTGEHRSAFLASGRVFNVITVFHVTVKF